jgi:hypothetical protein
MPAFLDDVVISPMNPSPHLKISVFNNASVPSQVQLSLQNTTNPKNRRAPAPFVSLVIVTVTDTLLPGRVVDVSVSFLSIHKQITMKFLQSVVLLALSAAVVPSYAFMTPSFLSSRTLKSSAALSMVATGDLTVHGEAKPRKTREVRSVLWCLT